MQSWHSHLAQIGQPLRLLILLHQLAKKMHKMLMRCSRRSIGKEDGIPISFSHMK